jgi:hypothetical protein
MRCARRCAPSIRCCRSLKCRRWSRQCRKARRRGDSTRCLIGSFTVGALVLSVLGIYSVIAFTVASHVHEMAIRMALGSQRGAIVRLVLASGAKLAAIICAIGLGGLRRRRDSCARFCSG